MASRALSLKLRYGFSLLCIVPPNLVCTLESYSSLYITRIEIIRGMIFNATSYSQVQYAPSLDSYAPASPPPDVYTCPPSTYAPPPDPYTYPPPADSYTPAPSVTRKL